MTPRPSDTAFMPASLPGVIFILSVYIGKTERFHDRRFDGAVDDFLYGKACLGALHLVPLGLGGRVARREQRAAVLVRDDRDRIGPEPLRFRGDFVLVHADQ